MSAEQMRHEIPKAVWADLVDRACGTRIAPGASLSFNTTLGDDVINGAHEIHDGKINLKGGIHSDSGIFNL